MNRDPAIFVIYFQDTNKKVFLLITFLRYIYIRIRIKMSRIRNTKKKLSAVSFFQCLAIKRLKPDPDWYPVLDPDPELRNPDPQQWFVEPVLFLSVHFYKKEIYQISQLKNNGHVAVAGV
jgi:hypothetical protein